ncbi:MAG: AbrB/MazE/SpoVT family DNA-binding domain-containing protein [Pseudomonadota bacterium]|nr:AbrB/MazE/SpoVT family DNA-binding domain-containing protein [Pseudomonadota bacterium]
MSSKRVTIPKKIRNSLNLQSGDKIEIVITSNMNLFHTAHTCPRFFPATKSLSKNRIFFSDQGIF